VSTAAIANGPEIFTAEDKRTQRKTIVSVSSGTFFATVVTFVFS
jgi:hypothetical protein